MSNTIIKLHFGALAGTIGSQLKEQNLNYDPKKIKTYDECLHAITLLKFHVFTDSQYKAAANGLFKKVIAHVKKLN